MSILQTMLISTDNSQHFSKLFTLKKTCRESSSYHSRLVSSSKISHMTYSASPFSVNIANYVDRHRSYAAFFGMLYSTKLVQRVEFYPSWLVSPFYYKSCAFPIGVSLFFYTKHIISTMYDDVFCTMMLLGEPGPLYVHPPHPPRTKLYQLFQVP